MDFCVWLVSTLFCGKINFNIAGVCGKNVCLYFLSVSEALIDGWMSFCVDLYLYCNPVENNLVLVRTCIVKNWVIASLKFFMFLSNFFTTWYSLLQYYSAMWCALRKLSLYFQCGYLDPAFGHCGGGGSNRIPVAALNGLVAGRWIAGVGCGSASCQIRALGRVIALVLRHHTLSLTWMIRFCSIC